MPNVCKCWKRILAGSATVAAMAALLAGMTAAGQVPAAEAQSQGGTSAAPKPETHITPDEAKELFKSVDVILRFVSEDTGLPIVHPVKRRLVSRAEVEKYVLRQLNEGKDARRMEHEEVVLKKFGLLDRDFKLRPFLVSLLTEQIAGYYDSKTKMVNLLDWVAPDEQKPVLAHELTHALQDQRVNLETWEPDTPDAPAKNVTEDNGRLAVDEEGTARDAALEGQATAVYLDYILKPKGMNLRSIPDVEEALKTGSSAEAMNSPVMARAPLLLKEVLLFPYQDGVGFEQTLLKDKGAQYAFGGVLDRPPATTYEIINPEAYERGEKVPPLRMPDIHGLLRQAGYEPYDIGAMGELDVRILSELFGGEDARDALTPEWNGGLYYVAQSRKAKTAAEKASTASLGLLYLSAWRSEGAAEEFARIYAGELDKKYSSVTPVDEDEAAGERVFRTNEGPVLIARQGKMVFVSESFDLDLAHKLEFLLMGAQAGQDTQVEASLTAQGEPAHGPATALEGFLAGCGVMKAALR